MGRTLIPVTALAALLIAFAAGCSKSEPDQAPSACLEGPQAYIDALQVATAEARLAGARPIADCLPGDQEGGELAEVGSAMVTAATRLNEEALRDPGGAATVQLGYLIGAAEAAAEDSAGIHSDLILRLNTAARFDPSGEPSAEFERAFERGYKAGRETG